MCLACEQQEYFFRLWCAKFLARNEMPPGVTVEDLQALGLSPPKAAAGGREEDLHKPQPGAGNAFACDPADE
jgi:hypothetical protein